MDKERIALVTAVVGLVTALATLGAQLTGVIHLGPSAPPQVAVPAGPGATPSDSVDTAFPPPGGGGGARWLSQMPPISSSVYAYEVGSRVMDGRNYEYSVATNEFCEVGSAGETEYALNKGYRRFRAILGVTDDFSPDRAVIFTVFLDGQKAEMRTLRLGQTEPLDVDVSGKLQLKLSADNEGGGCSSWRGYAVWGNAQLDP